MHVHSLTENSRNYYKIGAATTLLITTVAIIALMGLSQWQFSRFSQSISTFLSHEVALRASLVALVGTLALLLPTAIAHILNHRRSHLKTKYLKESDSEEVKEVFKHSSALWSQKSKKILDPETIKRVATALIEDPTAELDAVMSRLSCFSPQEERPTTFPTEEAQYYLKLTSGRPEALGQVWSTRIGGALVSVLGNLISAIGIADLFQSSDEDGMQSSIKSQKILMLVSLLNILITLLVPTLGARTTGLVIGSAVGGLTLLSFLWPWVKPIPASLPCNAQHLTGEARAGRITASEARRDLCDAIAETLIAGQHPLLVGVSRAGKTQIVRAFAKRVADGAYPELKGMEVYYWNTADLVTFKASSLMGGTDDPLQSIIRNVGQRNMPRMICCFDEIHNAAKGGSLADQMKPHLDTGSAFKHVIGITTDAEYAIIQTNPAFANRFRRIPVTNMSREGTIQLLADRVLEHPTPIDLEQGALDFLVNETSREHDGDTAPPQPYTASRIFDRCVASLQQGEETDAQRRIAELSAEKRSSVATALAECRSMSADALETLRHKETELQTLEAAESLKKLRLQQLRHAQKRLRQAQHGRYRAALRREAKSYPLYVQMEQALKDTIATTARSVGVSTRIDRNLISRMLEQDRAAAQVH